MDKLVLSKPETIVLINLYRENECLWKYSSPHYKRVDLKKKAWDHIADTMSSMPAVVKKKIKYLRTAYTAEKKKEENSKKSGAGADDLYRSNLFYYDEFKFLDSCITLRNTINNDKKEDSVSRDDEDIFGESTILFDETLSQPSKRSKIEEAKKAVSAKYEKAIAEIIGDTQLPEEDDVFSSFAKTIKLQLMEMPLENATEAMAEIQTITSKHTLEVLQARRQKRFHILEDIQICPPSTSPLAMRRSSTPYNGSSSSSLSDKIGEAMMNANIPEEYLTE